MSECTLGEDNDLIIVPSAYVDRLRERAEKSELKAKALDEQAGLNDLALERAQIDRDAAIERAEQAAARVRAVEAALGLQADYLALFQTRAEELHEAQSRVRELEAAMKTDTEATAGIGLAVAEYQERAEKAEARVRELEEREATSFWRRRSDLAEARVRELEKGFV